MQRVSLGSPETCGCAHCRNFATARDQVYPSAINVLLKRLGIKPWLESEIYHIGRIKPGVHLYGGWFHCVGSIEAEGDAIGPYDMEQGDRIPFRIYFANSTNLLPESFRDLPIIQVEFEAQVPWVLSESEPD
jgi:hypothetical protein